MKKYIMYSSTKCINDKPTGGQRRFLELANYLNEKKELLLCVPDDKNELIKMGLKNSFQLKSINNSKKHFIYPEVILFFKNFKRLKAIKAMKYEKIFVFDVPPAIFLCLLGVKGIVLMVRKDVIAYNNATHNAGIRRYIKNKLLLIAESISIYKSEIVIVQSFHDRNEIIRRHRYVCRNDIKKFKVVINNVNPTWIVKNSNVTSLISNNDEKKHICFVGGFNDLRKGQNLFLESALSIIRKRNDVIFDVVGDGLYFNEYKQTYSDKRIVFWGRLDNPLEVMKGSSLVVVPSLADSCPNTVFEAIFNDIPVCGSKVGGIPEIIGDEKYLFELSVDSLIEIIERFLNNELFKKEMMINQMTRKKHLMFEWGEKIIKEVQ